jgi:hypothetical protein
MSEAIFKLRLIDRRVFEGSTVLKSKNFMNNLFIVSLLYIS